jgi:predicted component of type VI protein secretion system
MKSFEEMFNPTSSRMSSRESLETTESINPRRSDSLATADSEASRRSVSFESEDKRGRSAKYTEIKARFSVQYPNDRSNIASHWDIDSVPNIKQIFEDTKGIYNINVTNEGENTVHVTGYYLREPDNYGNEVQISGACFGNKDMCEFIANGFPQTGVMSCAQLAYNPILKEGPPQELINNKIYQYLDLIDILMYTNRRDLNERTSSAFVMHSKYNNVIMIVNFGADVIITEKCGIKSTSRRISNDYFFGRFRTDSNGKLFKDEGKMLLMRDPQTYYMSGTDQIVTVINSKPDCKYEFVITDQGKTGVLGEDLSKFNHTTARRTLEDPTVFYGEFDKYTTKASEIHQRKEKISNVLKTLMEFNKRERSQKVFPCIDNPLKSCIQIVSLKDLKSLEGKQGQPISVRASDGARKDPPDSDEYTAAYVKNKVNTDETGVITNNLFRTYVLGPEILTNKEMLPAGSIIIFLPDQKDLPISTVPEERVKLKPRYFLKVRETGNKKSLFVELNMFPPVEYGFKEIRLSFPDIRKTFKISPGKLNQNLPLCNYLTDASPQNIQKLVGDYNKLTDAYVGLVTSKSKLDKIDIFDASEIEDVISNTPALKKMISRFGGSVGEHNDIIELRKILEDKGIGTSKPSTVNVSEVTGTTSGSSVDTSSSDQSSSSSDSMSSSSAEQVKSATGRGKYLKAIAVLLGSGILLGGIHLGMKAYTGYGLDDIVLEKILGYTKEVHTTLNDVSKTASSIINSGYSQVPGTSTVDLSKLTTDAANTIVNSRPDVAYETMKHHTEALSGIGTVFEKVSTMISSGNTTGMKFIGAGSAQDIAVSAVKNTLTGPLNQAQTTVLNSLEQLAGGTVSGDSIFEFTSGDSVIQMSAKDILAGAFDNNGVAIYSKVPGVVKNVIQGFQPAMECVQGQMTTAMSQNSTLCENVIRKAYENQESQFVSLGSSYWNTISGMSMVQMTTIALGVGAVGMFAGFIPAGWLVQFFAARAAPVVARIGFHELKTAYDTAIALGIPIVNELQRQIINHPTHSAQQFARSMGWIP